MSCFNKFKKIGERISSLHNTLNDKKKKVLDNSCNKQIHNTNTVDELINQFILKSSENDVEVPTNSDILKYPNATAYFKNGILYKVSPSPTNSLYEDRDVAYQARYIISDGSKYDLYSINDIAKLSIPKHFTNFSETTIGVVGSLDYILKMITGNCIEMGMKKCGALLTLKTYKFMKESPTSWQEKDFERLLINLYECGQFDIADKLEIELQQKSEKSKQSAQLEIFDSLNSGYFEATYFLGCCPECAKYRGRWYSNIDKKYPNLPAPYHCDCPGLKFFSVIPGASTPNINAFMDKKIDIVTFSNRPFVDDRTDEEKENYKKYSLEQQNKNKRDSIYLSDKKDYYILEYYFPEQKPKSFRSFMYKKRNKPEEYKELMTLVKKYKNN